MNDGAGGSRGRLRRPGPRRAGVLAAALAAIALLAAACGSNSAPDAGLTAYQQALAYSQCMRAHGVPSFPDPNSQGNFVLGARAGAKGPVISPLMARADNACKHLLPHDGVLTAAQLKQATAKALRFVACMRTNGLPTMPDPVVQNGGIALTIGHGVDPHSPVFQHAQHACRRFAPFGGGPP
jgi:hypothetical protein